MSEYTLYISILEKMEEKNPHFNFTGRCMMSLQSYQGKLRFVPRAYAENNFLPFQKFTFAFVTVNWFYLRRQTCMASILHFRKVDALNKEIKVYTEIYKSTWKDHNEVLAASSVNVRLWYSMRNFR